MVYILSLTIVVDLLIFFFVYIRMHFVRKELFVLVTNVCTLCIIVLMKCTVRVIALGKILKLKCSI